MFVSMNKKRQAVNDLVQFGFDCLFAIEETEQGQALVY